MTTCTTECVQPKPYTKTQHCRTCHQTFTSTLPGDMHRTGKHAVNEGPDRRRCRTTDEMTDLGMVRNDRGIWTSGGDNPMFGA